MTSKRCQYCGRKILGVNETQCDWNHRVHEEHCLLNKKSKKAKDYSIYANKLEKKKELLKK